MKYSDGMNLTHFIQLFSFVKVPLLALARPKVITLSEIQSTVRIPLNYITKNHVGSMYFGALSMGAELSIALRVVERMKTAKMPVTFIFKDFQCQFLKRADSDVDFHCLEVQKIDQLLAKALTTGQREELTLSGFANTKGETLRDQALMLYQLTISVKSTKK